MERSPQLRERRPALSLTGRDAGFGVAVLALAILAASRSTPSLWGVREVGVTYFPFRLVTDEPTGLSVYLALVVYVGLVALLGERLVLGRFGAFAEVSPPVRWAAGMVPGYVLVSGFNRLVTLLLPHAYAPWVIIAALVLAVALLSRRRAGGVATDRGVRGGPAGLVGVPATALGVAVFLLQRREMHIAGDAFEFFDRIFASPVFGVASPGFGAWGLGRLPLIAQHYDELSVLYPMVYGPLALFGGDPLACAWVIYTAFMTGAICLIYACARLLGMSLAESVLLVTVLCLGTFSLRPTRDCFLLFDSGNPLAFCLHPGRILGAVMPLAVATVYLRRDEARPPGGSQALALSALFACGIATTTFTNTLVLLSLAGFWILLDTVGIAELDRAVPARGRWLEPLIVLLLVAYPFVAYLNRRVLYSVSPWLLLATIALAAGCLFLVLVPVGRLLSPREPMRRLARWWPQLVGGSLGLGVGLLAFGNLLIGRTVALVGEPKELWGLRVLTRPVETALSATMGEMFGPYEGAGPLVTHLDGPFDFLARFGLAFLLAAGAFVLLRRARALGARSETGSVELLAFLAFLVLAFLVGLFGYDFMVGHVREQLSHWVRSRLLEPWFYGIVFLGLIALRRFAPGRGGAVAYVLLCLWVVKTMLFFPALAARQWGVNAAFFLREILSFGG